jgi:hypothetical protein
MAMERGGELRAVGIGPKGKKVPEAKGKRQVLQGTLVKAEAAGNQVNITVTVEGEEKSLSMSAKQRVMYRERGGTLKATRIMAAGRGKREKGGAEGEKKGKGRPKKKGAEAPENM